MNDETVRPWCAKVGPTFADGVRRRRPRPGDRWHLDAGTTELFHVFLGRGEVNATITDFDGVIAAAHILGTATQIQGQTRTPGLLLDGDLRFMQGVYVGVDGRPHRGTFGFF